MSDMTAGDKLLITFALLCVGAIVIAFVHDMYLPECTKTELHCGPQTLPVIGGNGGVVIVNGCHEVCVERKPQ